MPIAIKMDLTEEEIHTESMCTIMVAWIRIG